MDLWLRRPADKMESVVNKHFPIVSLSVFLLPSSVRLRGRRHQRPPGRPLRGLERRLRHRQPVQHPRYDTPPATSQASLKAKKLLFPSRKHLFFHHVPLARMKSVILLLTAVNEKKKKERGESASSSSSSAVEIEKKLIKKLKNTSLVSGGMKSSSVRARE